MVRSLVHYWRSHLALLLSAAVASAVLAGALVVGDSVRDSLRRLTEERLGRIGSALVSLRLLRQELAAELATRGAGDVVPALLFQGSAVHGGSAARASKVNIAGIDERFATLFERSAIDLSPREGQLFPSVVLNESLAVELGAEVGDELLLSFRRAAQIPEESLVGRHDEGERVESLRLVVTEILSDRGIGSFALLAHQSRPHNAFVDLERLQRALGERGKVNALLAVGEAEVVEAALLRSATADDLGLRFRQGKGLLVVESSEFVLPAQIAAAVVDEAENLGATAQPVLTYLANSIRSVEFYRDKPVENDREVGYSELIFRFEDRKVDKTPVRFKVPPDSREVSDTSRGRVRGEVPYSTVAAFERPVSEALGAFRLVDGSPVPELGVGEILLNGWAAADLGAAVGDSLVMTYFELGPRDELTTVERLFRLRGIVAMEGQGCDPTLTPDFPGMSGAGDMAQWDPPFPVDLDRIGQRDEEYWDLYRAAPKAFVALAQGRQLWRSRFGDTTSVRLAPAAAASVEELAQGLTAALPRHLGLDAFGLTFRPVRQLGLAAATGATDFSGLFLAFSQFLIVAAALLVGLLFRLSIEQRAKEVGLLRALGYPVGSIRRRFLAEGGMVAMVGALLGLSGAVAYAAMMLAGLRGRWLPAVGTPALSLSVRPATLAIGWAIAVAVVLFTLWWSIRRLGRVSETALLAGSIELPLRRDRRPGRLARSLAIGFGLAALGLTVVGWVHGERPSPGLTFGAGVCWLIAGLASLALYISPGRRREERLGGGLLAMAARSSSRNPGRSLLSAALIATACFVIVSVGAFRGGVEVDVTRRGSAVGGFSLIAESDVSLIQDLNRSEVRRGLGFTPEAQAVMAGATVVPMRLLPGEDASCLNLYAPSQPRVLGVPEELIERGGFRFKSTLRAVENPWTLLDEPLADEQGQVVIPAFGDFNSVTWILHSGLGQDLIYQDETGREVRLRLVGLLDGSLFQSELLISEQAFIRHFPSRSGYSVFLVETAPAEARAVAAGLEASLGRFGFDATLSAEKIAAFKAVEHTYISTFQAIGGLGLLLGTLGLGVVLLRNVYERRGELATLRAFGFRRSRLARMVVAETIFLLAVGIAIGAGAALAAAAAPLLRGAEPPPWLELAATLTSVFVVGLLASLAAVRRVLALRLLPLLKSE